MDFYSFYSSYKIFAERGNNVEQYDKIIIGAGIYGLYSAMVCSKQGQRVLVLERDQNAFMRATYINQARVHRSYRLCCKE